MVNPAHVQNAILRFHRKKISLCLTESLKRYTIILLYVGTIQSSFRCIVSVCVSYIHIIDL